MSDGTAGKMVLTSTAFAEGQPVPRKYTGDGQDVSPPLAWSGVPPTTKAFALVCDDPDAPIAEPWVHWVIYGLAADVHALPEGLPRKSQLTEPVAARQGVNTWTSDNIGYRGPAPPKGHGVHHYNFRLYALDAALDLKPGLDKHGLLKAINGHIVAQTRLTGTYQR